MAKERKHITLMRYFFPLLFLFYFGGITLFSHSHVVNGTIIVHSHPYGGEHQHTEASLETIFFLSAIQTFGDVPSSLTPVLFLFLLGCMLIPRAYTTPELQPYGVPSLRAPPFLFLQK